MEVGATDVVPPPAAIVRLLPLVPVIVSPVAFVVCMVKTDELPLVMFVGLALIVTVGATAAMAGLLAATSANAGIAQGSSIEST